MDELLRSLKQLSLDLMQKLERATVEDFVEFTQKREEIIEKVKQQQAGQTNTAAYARLVEEIAQCDAPILSRMNELKQEASDGLVKLGRSRMQKKAYESRYSIESAFIDKKK